MPAAEALWIRLFNTSAGAQIVVATVPAVSEARAWVPTSSFRLNVPSRWLFANEYLAHVNMESIWVASSSELTSQFGRRLNRVSR